MPKEQEFNMEASEEVREEIGRFIAEGITSGRIDTADGKYTYWEVKFNSWEA